MRFVVLRACTNVATIDGAEESFRSMTLGCANEPLHWKAEIQFGVSSEIVQILNLYFSCLSCNGTRFFNENVISAF